MTMVKALKKDDDVHALDLLASARIQIFSTAVAYTLGGLALFGGVGYLIDHFAGTFPIAFLVAIVLSFPVIQFSLFKCFRRFASEQMEKRDTQ